MANGMPDEAREAIQKKVSKARSMGEIWELFEEAYINLTLKS